MTIATDDFTGTDGAAINGRTTTTGSKTWAGSGWEINANRAYCPSGGAVALDAGVADVVMSTTIKAFGTAPLFLVRSNSARTTYLYVRITTADLRLYDEADTQIGSTYTGTVSVNDVISVETNGTSVIIKQNGTARVTTTTSTHQTQTYFGYKGFGSEIFDDFSVSAFTASDPTARLTTPLNTGNVYTATSGSGGTGTASYQWKRSTAPDTGFSSLSNGSGISGATSSVLTDGSATALAGTRLFYKCTISWSGSGGPFDSNVLGAVLGKRPAYSLVIGDSIEAGNGVESPRVKWLTYVTSLYGPRAALYYNAASGGQGTNHWYDSAGSGAQAALASDLSAGISAGCTVLEIRLGYNDASSGRTSSVYAANLAGIAAAALAAGYTRVILHYPIGAASTANMALMLTYLTAIDGLANGSTIFVGDVWSFDYFASRPDLQQDGIHPTDAGNTPLAVLTALGTAKGLGDLPSSGGGFGRGGFSGGING